MLLLIDYLTELFIVRSDCCQVEGT